MFMRIPLIAGGLMTAIGLALTPLTAAAAPQMMALVSNDQPVPLQCLRGDCFAELTAFCLQPERRSPAAGTAYELVTADAVVIEATTRNGAQIRLDPRRDVSFHTERTHVAVRVSMPAKQMYRMKLRDVRVRVLADAALTPVPHAADPSPLRPQEVELVLGHYRALGRRVVDEDGGDMPVVRAANRMINALPPGGRADEAARRDLWQQIARDAGGAANGAGPAAKVRQTYDHCRRAAFLSHSPSMRQCLQAEHDGLVGGLNNRYWDAIATGS